MNSKNTKDYLKALRQVKQLVANALALSEATGQKKLSQEDGSLKVEIQPMTKDFFFYTAEGEAKEIKISGQGIPGSASDTIRAARSIARTFNAKVEMKFNGTPMTSYPRSTQREVDLNWSYRRVLIQHPEINP